MRIPRKLLKIEYYIIKILTQILTNSTLAEPGPTSAFLSCGAPGVVGARRYIDLSSAERAGASDRPTAPRRTVSTRTDRLSVAGTISGGKWRKILRYSMPSFVRYLEIKLYVVKQMCYGKM